MSDNKQIRFMTKQNWEKIITLSVISIIVLLVTYFLTLTIVRAQPNSTTADLKLFWDYDRNDTLFNIEHRLGDAGTFTSLTNTEVGIKTYVHAVGLGTKNCYRVRAIKDQSTSDWSNISCMNVPLLTGSPKLSLELLLKFSQ